MADGRAMAPVQLKRGLAAPTQYPVSLPRSHALSLSHSHSPRGPQGIISLPGTLVYQHSLSLSLSLCPHWCAKWCLSFLYVNIRLRSRPKSYFVATALCHSQCCEPYISLHAARVPSVAYMGPNTCFLSMIYWPKINWPLAWAADLFALSHKLQTS